MPSSVYETLPLVTAVFANPAKSFDVIKLLEDSVPTA